MPQFLSEHFTFEEATFSILAERAGIDNTHVSPEVFIAAQRTAAKMEKVRLVLDNTSIRVHSWIRCLELNRMLGSKDTSQHVDGEAVDFTAPKFGTPLAICRRIVENKDLIRYDQLILEHTWVHISFCSPNDVPRGQVLSLLKGGGYAVGLTDANGVPYKS